MKIKHITKPNKKGQIVIPKEIRDKLGINPSVPLNLSVTGNSIHIQPIKEVVTEPQTESTYVDILDKTKGKWDKEEWKKTREKRKKTELKASEKRKQQW